MMQQYTLIDQKKELLTLLSFLDSLNTIFIISDLDFIGTEKTTTFLLVMQEKNISVISNTEVVIKSNLLIDFVETCSQIISFHLIVKNHYNESIVNLYLDDEILLDIISDSCNLNDFLKEIQVIKYRS